MNYENGVKKNMAQAEYNANYQQELKPINRVKQNLVYKNFAIY